MAIRTVITRGFGNGTYNGTIPLVVTRGYDISTAITVVYGATGTVHRPNRIGTIKRPDRTGTVVSDRQGDS